MTASSGSSGRRAHVHQVLAVREQVRHAVSRAGGGGARASSASSLGKLLPRSIATAPPDIIDSIFPSKPFEDAKRFEQECTSFYSIETSRQAGEHNRYSDIFAYERTRVRVPLGSTSRDGKVTQNGDMYLNANLIIDDFANFWIASQAPPPSAFYPFLSAVYHQSATEQYSRSMKQLTNRESSSRRSRHCIVVQLTALTERGMIKADQYLPTQLGRSLVVSPPQHLRDSHTPLHLKTLEMESFPDIACVRSLVSLSASPPSVDVHRQPPSNGLQPWESISQEPTDGLLITHFAFEAWPDYGVPLGEDVEKLRRLVVSVEKMKAELEAEVWVHCSAGIGRTGTFVAISSLLSRKQDVPRVNMPSSPLGPLPELLQDDDVARTIDLLREQRGSMCQTQAQEELVYRIVVDGEGST